MFEYAYFVINPESKGFDAATLLSAVTAIMALIVSIFAVWTSRKQLQISISHNILSVRPLIGFIQDYSAKEQRLSISIVNGGLGPTQIKSLKIMIDGKALTSPHAMVDAFDVLAKDLKTSGGITEIIGKEHAIRSGDKIDLISFGCTEEIGFEFFSRLEQRCKIEIVYASIYDELFKTYYPGGDDVFRSES